MKRPDLNIPVIMQGTYIQLNNNMEVDWKRYAKDLDLYINNLEDNIKIKWQNL